MIIISISLIVFALSVAVYFRRFVNRNRIIFVVLGSGGHTSEMFRILMKADVPSGHRICFIVGKDDNMSLQKAKTFCKIKSIPFEYETVIRPRRVHQPILFAIPTLLLSICQSVLLVAKHRPSIILTNGPALCVIIALAGRLLNLSYNNPKIVYIESFARVYNLSLSGKCMEYLANKFYVQWPEIQAPKRLLRAQRLFCGGPLV